MSPNNLVFSPSLIYVFMYTALYISFSKWLTVHLNISTQTPVEAKQHSLSQSETLISFHIHKPSVTTIRSQGRSLPPAATSFKQLWSLKFSEAACVTHTSLHCHTQTLPWLYTACICAHVSPAASSSGDPGSETPTLLDHSRACRVGGGEG